MSETQSQSMLKSGSRYLATISMVKNDFQQHLDNSHIEAPLEALACYRLANKVQVVVSAAAYSYNDAPTLLTLVKEFFEFSLWREEVAMYDDNPEYFIKQLGNQQVYSILIQKKTA